MNKYNYTKAVPGEKPLAVDHNQMTQIINAVAASLHIQGLVDSSGFHTRRQPIIERTRLAYCKEDAPAGLIIDCYLDTDLVGEEVEVTCNIAQAGANLGDATPLLITGDPIVVTIINNIWYCTSLFNPAKECTCVEP